MRVACNYKSVSQPGGLIIWSSKLDEDLEGRLTLREGGSARDFSRLLNPRREAAVETVDAAPGSTPARAMA